MRRHLSSEHLARRLSIRKEARTGWRTTDNLAKRAIGRHGISSQITATDVCDAANSLATPDWRAISFADHRLKIRCLDYNAIGTIKLREPELIKQINDQLGERQVLNIAYELQWGSESDTLSPS